MTASITTIFHKTTGTAFEVTDKTNTAIIADIKKAGFILGAKNLAAMLKGEKVEGGDFTTIQPVIESAQVDEVAPETEAVAHADATPTTVVVKAPRVKKPTLYERVLAAGALPIGQADPDKLAAMSPEARAIAEAELEEQRKAAMEAEKPSFRGTDWSKVLPQEPQPVKEGSKMHKFFMFLCSPDGVTKDEILTEFGWSAGGLAGIIHWEPKAKGYMLASEKGADGKLRYSLAYIGQNGRKVKAEDVIVRAATVKAAPAPKVAKAPKAEPAVKVKAPKAEPAVKVKVPKDAMAQAAANLAAGGAAITKRVAVRKAAK